MYVKTVLLAVAAVILVVEGFFLYGFYRDNYGGAASTDTPAPETTTRETTTLAEAESANGGSPEGTTYVHRATPGNTSSNSTFLDNPLVNGNPDAILLVTPVSDSNAAGNNAHEIGVWYYSRSGRWAIFNQDLAPMPDDAVFNVIVLSGAGTVVHRSTASNTAGAATYIDDPLTNRAPKAILSVTQNWNPGGGPGTYNDHPVGVRYDPALGRWTIFNRDSAPMPEDAGFNVAVSPRG